VVNKLMIQSRLALINDGLLQLERHATVRREDFVGDKDRVAATKRVLNNSPLWRGARVRAGWSQSPAAPQGKNVPYRARRFHTGQEGRKVS